VAFFRTAVAFIACGREGFFTGDGGSTDSMMLAMAALIPGSCGNTT